jgi:hypothetical protein
MFTLSCVNSFDESHVLNVQGTDVPYSDESNSIPVNIDIAPGTLVTAYVRYPSADFTGGSWSLDSLGVGNVNPGGSDTSIKDADGNPFNSSEVGTFTVAGEITENRVQFFMPSYSFNLIAFVTSSTAIGVSPESRVDLNTIDTIEFNGEVINNLYIDGVQYWDVSLPAGQKFIDQTIGYTFLILDE